jgi:rhodanese-related sulfurtransferase
MADADDFPSSDVPVESLDPGDLEARIESGAPVTILDVRATSEYGKWHIGGENVRIVNVPCFDFLEGVTDDLLAQVPEGDPVVAVCAKGGASEYVAGLLLEEGIDAVNLADGLNGWTRVYVAGEVTAAPPARDGPAVT